MITKRRTTAATRQRAPSLRRRRPPMAVLRRRRIGHNSVRQRLRGAARLHIDIRLRNGLQAKLDIGPAWIGVTISTIVASWWPQIAPLILPLLKLL
jgi:hypothetical protein